MKLALLGAVAALAVTAPAMAHRGHNPDADGDGQVTKAEHDAGVAAIWKEMDKDGNGQLSPAELGEKAAKMKAADTDGDGQISAAEFQAKKAAWFAAADKDGNGSLSTAEMAAAKKAG